MNIKFTLRGVELNRSEIDMLRRKAEFAVDLYREETVSVDVVLEDLGGPPGGDDKLCRVILHLAGEPAVILQERGEMSMAAGMAALERAAQSLQRRYEQMHSWRQNGSHQSASTPC